MSIKYYLRWDGKEKSRKASGELEVPKKIGEAILRQLILLKVGDTILKKVNK